MQQRGRFNRGRKRVLNKLFDELDAATNEANALLKDRRYLEAKTHFEQILNRLNAFRDKHSDNRGVQYYVERIIGYMASCHMGLEQFEVALRYYYQLKLSCPKDNTLKWFLARCHAELYMRSGDGQHHGLAAVLFNQFISHLISQQKKSQSWQIIIAEKYLMLLAKGIRTDEPEHLSQDEVLVLLSCSLTIPDLCKVMAEYYLHHKESPKAVFCYTRLQKFQPREAYFALGELYISDDHGIYDVQKAYDYFVKAYDEEDENAAFEIYRIFVICEDPDALQWLNAAIDLGALSALDTVNTQYLYSTDEGDRIIAERYYEKLINKGHAHVNLEMAILYRMRGELKKAIEYAEKALESGNYRASVLLGKIYRDLNQHEQSLKYFELGDQHNITYATVELAEACIQDNKFAKAIQLFDKAIKNDGEKYLVKVAEYHLKGKFGKFSSDEKAFDYFTRADENRDLHATYRLGYCHLNGRGTKKDPKKAHGYFLSSAARGHAKGKLNLLNGLINTSLSQLPPFDKLYAEELLGMADNLIKADMSKAGFLKAQLLAHCVINQHEISCENIHKQIEQGYRMAFDNVGEPAYQGLLAYFRRQLNQTKNNVEIQRYNNKISDLLNTMERRKCDIELQDDKELGKTDKSQCIANNKKILGIFNNKSLNVRQKIIGITTILQISKSNSVNFATFAHRLGKLFVEFYATKCDEDFIRAQAIKTISFVSSLFENKDKLAALNNWGLCNIVEGTSKLYQHHSNPEMKRVLNYIYDEINERIEHLSSSQMICIFYHTMVRFGVGHESINKVYPKLIAKISEKQDDLTFSEKTNFLHALAILAVVGENPPWDVMVRLINSIDLKAELSCEVPDESSLHQYYQVIDYYLTKKPMPDCLNNELINQLKMFVEEHVGKNISLQKMSALQKKQTDLIRKAFPKETIECEKVINARTRDVSIKNAIVEINGRLHYNECKQHNHYSYIETPLEKFHNASTPKGHTLVPIPFYKCDRSKKDKEQINYLQKRIQPALTQVKSKPVFFSEEKAGKNIHHQSRDAGHGRRILGVANCG